MDNDYIIIVFRKCSEFLTKKDIDELKFLNQHFYREFFNKEVSYNLCLQFLSSIFFQYLDFPEFVHLMRQLLKIEINHYDQVEPIFKYSKNLISNPIGQLGFENWTINQSSWIIENFNTFRNQPSCYVGTSAKASLNTCVVLPKFALKRKLFVGTPVGVKPNCGVKFSLQVVLFGKSQKSIHSLQMDLEYNDSTFYKEPQFSYRLASVCIDLDEDDQYAEITFSIVNGDYWKEGCELRLGYCFARILVLDNVLGNS